MAANNELRALTRRLGQENPSTNGDYTARAIPLATEIVGFFRPALFALFGAAAFLLVITCTNVASLLLARATVREREVAVRAAIGASRSRLIRQFLTEILAMARDMGFRVVVIAPPGESIPGVETRHVSLKREISVLSDLVALWQIFIVLR